MKKLLWAVVIAASAVLAISFMPQPATTSVQAAKAVAYDVSLNGETFTLNQSDNGATDVRRGDVYLLNGQVYPGGTIPAGGSRTEPSSFGPDSPGSIGSFYCKGVFLVGAKRMEVEKIQRASTQYFVLNNKSRLITEGFEGSTNTNRIILGGVGEFAGARGVVTMERIGINATGSYNLRFTFNLE
ncbi:MAG TPA: hypothetical protein VLH08_02630 [Acidobacteriota bacterium]|nr:hypothetical protein [Acidobacteriota bacterium]